MSNLQEIWKDVPGYEGLYKVSTTGLVFSLRKNKRIKGCIDKKGYHEVIFYKGGNQKHFKAHRLVAILFIPNTHNKPTVNHIDGNKLNNNVGNLEWSTHLENNLHSLHVLGNKTGGRFESHPLNKISKEQSNDIKKMKADGIPIIDIAKKFGIHKEHARKVANVVYWK